jgi:energy-coupling factor transporter ATP-binding protein EcfA2
MRFTALKIVNLRAVRSFEIADLKDFIVIAGPNGCGKSCLFDAIRLLKSAYGGDEYQQWFGEFQINLDRADQLPRVFRDKEQPVELSATLQLAESERSYLQANATQVLWPYAWEQATNQRVDYATFSRASVGPNQQHHWASTERLVTDLAHSLIAELKESDSFYISLSITPQGQMVIHPCLPAQIVFQTDLPQHLGIIEYHSASRTYAREQVGGVNLDPTAFQSERRQQRLFNWQAKYQNVKSQLVTGYLRGLISKEAGEKQEGLDLNETLKELFRTFFPDKEYLGITPRPDSQVEFPVRLPDGETHDIDDLSSGEKEILYGYLRLRNSTPRHSVVLLDEPELHLNPGLLQGFADFYHRHLGAVQDNQLWLVTHSDTLLRNAIGNPRYGVYHMQTANSTKGNQASEILLDDDVERAVRSLVGDLAAYRPHAKVVILEGSVKNGFDATLIKRLFPEFAKRVNLVSAESKKRVTNLYEAMNDSVSQVGIQNRFFAIVDKDAEGFRDDEGKSSATVTSWDVYHIENFLLHPQSILEAVNSISGTELFSSADDIVSALRSAASEIVDRLVLLEIRAEINEALVGSIAVRAAPDSADIPADLIPSIQGSVKRIGERSAIYTEPYLQAQVNQLRSDFTDDLSSEAWLSRFPGRDILKRFAHIHLSSDYETFRNVIMDKMALSEYRPITMEQVLNQILAADDSSGC